MAGYKRQSNISNGNVIEATLFNDEYNKLATAFSNTGGHKHDGSLEEGPVIGLIGDAGLATPLNKIVVDTTNDHLEFYVDVSGTATQQFRIEDGAIVPITDNDIDLGTSSLEFKDLYIDGVAYVDSIAMPTTTVTDILDEDNMSSDSATALSTQQSIKAYVDTQVGTNTLTVYKYTATAGQTTFTGSDDASATLAYTVGNLFVTVNGITLENGTDYTATNGTSVVLTDAATVGDEVNIYVFAAFNVSNVTQANGDFSVGDDLTLGSDGAIINMGADSDVTMTHVHDKGVQFNTQPIIPTPTFRACKVTSNQTFSNATYTKITFNQEDWDIGGYYASDTYTPLVQGYYQVNVSLHLSSANDHDGGLVALYHNGSMTRFNRLYRAGLTNDDFYLTTMKFNGMLYMDGVDDTLEVYYYSYSEDSGDCIIGADSRSTYFEAFLVSRSG